MNFRAQNIDLSRQRGFATGKTLLAATMTGLGALAVKTTYDLEVSPYIQQNIIGEETLYNNVIPMLSGGVTGLAAALLLLGISKALSRKPEAPAEFVRPETPAPVIVTSQETSSRSVLGPSEIVQNGFNAASRQQLDEAIAAVERQLVSDVGEYIALQGMNTDQDPAFRNAVIGNYKILRQIGEGGMGKVYLARQEKLDRLVIIKAPLASLMKNEEYRLLFEREAKAVASISHSNIMQIYDFIDDGQKIYYVGEHVKGITLKQLLKLKANKGELLSPAEVTVIAMHMFGAMEAAHAKGIAHRDLKPDNIMISEEGVLKLIDFGLAKGKEDDSLTQVGTAKGTYKYLGPEVVNMRNDTKGFDFDRKLDFYAVGIMLYEFLVGKAPREFPGSNAVMTFIAFATENFLPVIEDPKFIPGQLREFIVSLTERDPEKRLTDIARIKKELSHAAAELLLKL